MSNPIRLYVIGTEDRPVAYPLELVREECPDLDTDEKVEAFFGPGTWHEIHVGCPYTGRHDQEVKKKITRYDRATGLWTQESDRFLPALVEVAVTQWTFAQPHTEEGLLMDMPEALRQVVCALVHQTTHYHLYESPLDLLRTIKAQKNASQSAPDKETAHAARIE